jgi:plasmid stability protein
MKNITITLDPETAAWVRVHAAEQNKSVSRLVGEILQARMKPPFDLTGEPEKYPTRDEIYDRARIR